jgi:tRNA-2-methylthio-N6-dimethylallyladenosine synthase
MTTARFQTRSAQETPSSSKDLAPAVHVVTFGCQMNKYDSLLVEGRFTRRGWRTTESMEEADVVLFNTCSVRDHAEERAWSWVGELKREKERRPDLVVGVMGCMAQRVGDEVFRRAGHVDLVAGTRQFHLLPELVDQVLARRRSPDRLRARDMRLLATDMEADVDADRSDETYAGGRHGYLAVMRGCDLNCTFCIVPTTRGRVRSKPIEAIVEEARWMVSQGAQVITLLGQTVNSYGEDVAAPGPDERHWSGRQGRPSLADVLRRLQQVDGLERIRMVTLHPSYVTPAFARAIADCDKVERFLPLPVQSGSDSVLKRMKRGYNLDLYRKRVAILRAAVPDIELGTDWIVGFSGESEPDFEASLALLEEIGFAQSYVFKYDPRPGTTAEDRLPDDVSEELKRERNQRLLAAAEGVQRARLEAFRGRELHVFVESVSERDERILLGRSRHGLPVSLQGPSELVGREVRVCIEHSSAYGMSGSLPAD